MKISEKRDTKQVIKWAVYGISVAALLFVLIAAYLIACIAGGYWAVWQLPVILAIVFFTLVVISAMFVALPEIKAEIQKELDKENEKKAKDSE